MIDLASIERFEDLNDDCLSDVLEDIVNGDVEPINEAMIQRVLRESFRRDDPDVIWNALEVVALRTDVDATELLISAAQKEQESSVAIFLIEQLLDRSDHLNSDIFLCFLSSEYGELVRETAARALLILGEVRDVEKVQVTFGADSDILVKINLASLLFLLLRKQDFFSFVQEHCNDLNLEIAKEARECTKLVREHLSQ